jgi:Animal haem peroxidase
MRKAMWLASVLLTSTPALCHAGQTFFFGRMFGDLPQYTAPTDQALAALTSAGTDNSPGPLFDTGGAVDNNPDGLPSFFTYFGQFVDHDMTLDTLPLPTSFIDPSSIENHRDPRLNLDSVYGGGPGKSPQLYEDDGAHLKTNGRDLPRNPDGSAILVEGRNDENQVISQLHVAFLRAHNALIDQGYGFGKAQQLMRMRYQWIIVHEFLKETLDPDVYADVFRTNGDIVTRYFAPKHAKKAVMPVEFSVSAYRFGHSQVRQAYRLTSAIPRTFVRVFNGSDNDLHGGRPISSDHLIFWGNFLPIDGQPATNISRKIDTLLSSGLFFLPIPGAEASGSSILALRNIQRARSYGLPSGQAVARRLGLPVLSNVTISATNNIPRLAALYTDPAYQGEAPLWLYVLAESQIVHNGAKLGPVGSRIVAEVIGGFIASDNRSFYNKGWRPPGGSFTAEDLLKEAQVLCDIAAGNPNCQ